MDNFPHPKFWLLPGWILFCDVSNYTLTNKKEISQENNYAARMMKDEFVDCPVPELKTTRNLTEFLRQMVDTELENDAHRN